MSVQDTLEEELQGLTAELMAELMVGLPGKVASYDAATQTADVDVMLRRPLRVDEDEEGELEFVAYPRLPRVRVMNLAWGAWTITAPLAAGDPCFVQVLDADPSAYLRTGNASNPERLGRHRLAFAVCWPALRPDPAAISNAHADRMVIGKDGDSPRIELTAAGGVIVHSSDIKLGSAAASVFVALSTKVDTAITNLQVALDTHKHILVQPGAGSSGITDTIVGGQGATAATKVRAE